MRFLGVDALNALYAACAVAALVVGWLKVLGPWVSRRWTRLVGFVEAIAGREPIIDKASGVVKAPAVPPLGVRLASIDDTMQKLVVVIESNHDAHKRLDNHEGRLSLVETEVDGLKDATAERIANKIESAAVWQAVANADIEPGEVADET